MTLRVFLQARMGSSRLPGKAMKILADKTLTRHCLEALKPISEATPVLVTDQESAKILEPEATRAGWALFVGSAENVLDRFYKASLSFPCDWILRATGDNPLVSSAAAHYLIEKSRTVEADFLALDGLPLGTGVELFSSKALRQAANSQDPFDQEHVGPAFYNHPEHFKCLRFPAPHGFQLPGARVTVDTPEDFAYLEELFNDLYTGQPLTIEEILPWIQKHPR